MRVTPTHSTSGHERSHARRCLAPPGDLGGHADRLQLAGQRPSSPAVRDQPTKLHLSLLGDLQRVVDLDSEVSDGALKFAVAEQKLNRPEIPGPPVDQCRFGAPH